MNGDVIGHDVSKSIFKFHRTSFQAISALINRGRGDGERDSYDSYDKYCSSKLQILRKSSTLVANTPGHPLPLNE